MFPLGTALVPHQVLALQVFEPRYLSLVQHCLAGDGRLGVVLIERGSEVGGGDTRFDVGTVARIVDVAEIPGDRLGVRVIGEERIVVTRWLDDDPFPRADVRVVADPELDGDREALRREIELALDRVVAAARALGATVPEHLALPADPVRAAWHATAMAPISPIDVLGVLQEADPEHRIARVIRALGDAAELLELQAP